MFKVQNTFPIKDDLIHCSIVLYKKENLSTSKEKKRNRSLLDNKGDFFYKKKKNKKSVNIRININNNNYKTKNKPLTCSCSEKKNMLQIKKKEKINSMDKRYKKYKIDNDSIKYRPNNSVNVKTSIYNNINTNNSSIFIKNNKNKKKETKLKKKKFGEIVLYHNNLNKNIDINSNLDYIDNLKEKSTKNKNKIIIYNNIFKNEKNRNINYFSKIEKHKIDTSVNKSLNLDKVHIIKNNSYSQKRNKKIDHSKLNDNMSNLTKRKSYLVPSIRAKKKKKDKEKEKEREREKEKEKEDKNKNEINIYNEENKQLYMSHLIESKQIEYLKDYEKYKNDFKDKLIKNNEKKIRAINDENLIDKLLSSDEDEENKDTREDNEELNNKKDNKDIKEININANNEEFKKYNNEINININNIKINEKSVKQKNYQNNESNQYSEYNICKKNNDDKQENINENITDSIDEENKNDNVNDNNIIDVDNNVLIYNMRKPKINTLEYVYRINNNIDVNKLITSLSNLDLQNNESNNMNENNNDNENEKVSSNAPESQSSATVLYEKKNVRPKEEINDFMKNNRIKFRNKEIKLKKEKKDIILKKFINFVELQKKIEENRKIKLINKSLKLRNNSAIKNNKNSEENLKVKTLDEFRLSQNTSSLSSSLNQQEVYLNIYDTQKIYSSKDNHKMINNRSMIIDNEYNRKLFNLYNDNNKSTNDNNKKPKDNYIKNNIINKKISFKNIINNKINENKKIKKLDKNALEKIKNVITRLNNFLNHCPLKKKEKSNKNFLINKYDYLIKNASKFLLEKNKNKGIIIKNYLKKNEVKKKRIKSDKIIIVKKQIPSDDKNFKKISMNEFKKIINHSQNNIYANKFKLDNSNDIELSTKEKPFMKNLNKNHSAIINKNKTYSFTEEQLNKYLEIFNYLFLYLKLFIQKNIFNIIILYANMKNKYIMAFNQIIYFIKKRPFNYLRIIQQREYYQVILRQFYVPYLNRAFYAIKSYSTSIQKFSEADNIIKQIYFLNFLKKMLFYIELKESYINKRFEDDKIIEEKDEISYESSSKLENKNYVVNHEEEEEIEIQSKTNDNYDDKTSNNKNDNSGNNNQESNSINSDVNINQKQNQNDESKVNENNASIKNNNQNINEESFNKENSESYDEIKVITNTFNTIIYYISRSPKIYIFDLFKKYYLESKNKKNINEIKNEEKNIDDLNNSEKNLKNREIKEENKLDSSKNEYSNDNKYNTYLYESLTEKSSISAFPNSEGSDRLHRVYAYLSQQQNANTNTNNNEQIHINTNNEKIQINTNIQQIQINTNNFQIQNNYKIEKINHQNQYNIEHNNSNNNSNTNSNNKYENKEKKNNNYYKNKSKSDNKQIENKEKEIIYYKNKSKSDTKQSEKQEINEKMSLSYEDNKKEEMGLFIPYKGEIKKNLMNKLINTENNNNINNNEDKDDISEEINISDKILKDEFKKYEQNKKYNIKNEDENIDENNEEKNDYNKNEVIENNNNDNIINYNENIDNKDNTYSSEEEEINLPIKQSDYMKRKKEINNPKENNTNNISKKETENFINYNSLNFTIKNNEITSNKRYTESEEVIYNDDYFEVKGQNILSNISNEVKQKIAEELTNEIMNDLLKEEIKTKKNILSYKKDIKKNSNSSINGITSKENMSALSQSPGIKVNKSNNSQNLINSNESYPAMTSNNNSVLQDEDALNNSIFKRTVYEIKKDIELNFYEKYIFPKFLQKIENNINKNYINIINNLKKPLKKNEEEVMEDIANLITYDSIYNNTIIKYNSRFYNKEIIKKEYIDKKILDDFNSKLEKESRFYVKYYYQYLNQCIYDTTNEIIRNKRMYGNIGEPLLWSMRNRNLDYKYKDSKLFKKIFTSSIINELKKTFFSKIGAIIENGENINISQFSKERDIKFNENIREELKKENELNKLDEQETVVKITIAKIIMNQLLNEVIEILEHIQYSRKEPEKYNYKSIFSCDNIPLLSFQNVNNKNDNDDEEEERSEDRINQ